MNFLGKKIRNRYLLLGDIFLSAVSVLASYMIRLELIAIFPTYQVSLLWMLGIAIVVKPLVYYFFGIYRRLWLSSFRHHYRLVVYTDSCGWVSVHLPLDCRKFFCRCKQFSASLPSQEMGSGHRRRGCRCHGCPRIVKKSSIKYEAHRLPG